MNINILITTVQVFSNFLYWAIFIRVIMSWFPIGRDNSFVILLNIITEPILSPIRSMISKSPLGGSGMRLDFSPIIALIFINIVRSILMQILRSL